MEGVFDTVIPEIQHALRREHYEMPTPVQAQAIPPQVAGDDLFGSAQTGTGKTAAFTIPLLQELSSYHKRPDSGCPRALILAPTRELAAQIGESIATYGRFLHVSHTVIFGGVGQRPQELALDRGVDIVVATPGRLLDLMGQGHVDLSQVETFILDEADRMLDMGFIPDIEKVIARLPEDRRNGFFSATVPKAVEELAGKILVNPVQVKIDPEKPTVDKIDQRVLYVDRAKKDDLLIDMIRRRKIKRAIVFVKMKYRASRVCDRLGRAGISSEPIHGNKSQAARTVRWSSSKREKSRCWSQPTLPPGESTWTTLLMSSITTCRLRRKPTSTGLAAPPGPGLKGTRGHFAARMTSTFCETWSVLSSGRSWMRPTMSIIVSRSLIWFATSRRPVARRPKNGIRRKSRSVGH